VLGATASQSGYLMVPMMLMVTAGSVISGQLISRTGKYKWVALLGLAILAGGDFLLSRISPTTTQTMAMLHMVVLGSGLGLLMPVYTIAGQNAVPQRMIGVATGVIQFFRSIGSTLGAAVFNSILLLRYKEYLNNHIPAETPIELRHLMANPLKLNGGSAGLGSIPGGSAEIMAIIKEALVYALDAIFLIAGMAMVACFLLNLFLPERELRGHPENVPAAPADPEIVMP